MGLMEVELALAEHRQRLAAAERRHSLRREARERKRREALTPGAAPEAVQAGTLRPKLDWPVFTLRLGPLRLAVFRTVRLPSAGAGRDSYGTHGAFPG